MIKIIDPPSGWLYGFPKEIPEDVTDVRGWLVQNGYPMEELEAFGDVFPYRCWYEGDDD